MASPRFSIFVTFVLSSTPALALGQGSATPAAPPDTAPYRTYGAWPAMEPPPDGPRQVSNITPPMIADTDRYPAPLDTSAPPPWRLVTDTRLVGTWLPALGSNGLGMADLELASTLNLPLADGWAPLTVAPYAAAHRWSGQPGLPSYLYDLNVEIGWRPRLAQWFFLDLAVTPGLYTDFKDVTGNSFQMRGRVVGIVAFSPQFQLAAGAMYVNRNRTKVLPVGGVIWNPSEDTRWFLIFPQPKISHRFATIGDTQLWGYVAGEFGGGRWQVELPSGVPDSLDYTDWRALVGLEAVHAQRLRGQVEFGYVFNRRVNFAGEKPDYLPPSTVLFRMGLRY